METTTMEELPKYEYRKRELGEADSQKDERSKKVFEAIYAVEAAEGIDEGMRHRATCIMLLQVPIKVRPLPWSIGSACPKCKTIFTEIDRERETPHCPWCGQELDWR